MSFGARLLWASLAGLLFSQAHLWHGALAWPGAVAMGVAVSGIPDGPRRRPRLVWLCAVVQGWQGLHCWPFLHYGPLLYAGAIAYLLASGASVGLLLAGRRPAASAGSFSLRAGLAFLAVDYVHQLGPLGFPLILGGSQVHLPWRGAIAVVGAVGLSGLIVGSGVAVGGWMSGRLVGSAGNRRGGHGRTVSAWILATLLTWLLGNWQPGLSTVGAPLRVAIVQGSVPNWLYVMANSSRAGRLLVEARYHRLTREALSAERPVDLVVLPEAALHREIAVVDGRALEPLFARPPDLGHNAEAAVITGAYREVLSENGRQLRLFNTALLLSASDPRAVIGWADKRVLAPLSEARFEPAEEREALEVAGRRMGVLICFEATYPRLARELATELESHVLVVITNDAGVNLAPVTLSHARQGWARAVEVGRPLVRAAQAGISLAVTASGELLGQKPLFEAGVLYVEVQPMRGWTWFSRFGYGLGPLSLMLAVVWALWPRRRVKTNSKSKA